MGLGSNQKSGNLVILKPVTRIDGEYVSPYFSVTKKVDGKWTTLEGEEPTSVSGRITRFEMKEASYKDNSYIEYKLFLQDEAAQETYLLDFRSNMTTRSIFNALLSIEDFDAEYSLSIYSNNAGYPAMSMWSDGSMVQWKYSKEEIPEVKIVKYQGKDTKDYFDIEVFFNEKLEEWAKTIPQKEESSPEKEERAEDSVNTVDDSEPDNSEDDNIPF